MQVSAPGFLDPTEELLAFIADRLKIHLREQGTPHDVVAAVFGRAGEADDDLVRLLERIAALRAFLASEGFQVAGRVPPASIVAIEERKDGRGYGAEVDRALLRQPEEYALIRPAGRGRPARGNSPGTRGVRTSDDRIGAASAPPRRFLRPSHG